MVLHFGAKLVVLVLQVQDHRDPDEVEPALEQGADASEPVDVVGAVAAGAALCPGGFK